MSEDLVESLALYLTIPATVLLLLLAVVTIIGRPPGSQKRSKERQQVELKRRSASSESRVTIEWMDYKFVPKSFIIDLFEACGWRYMDQSISGNSWSLRFSRSGSERVRREPGERLHEELANARPDKHGSYALDISDYEILSCGEIENIVKSAGWKVSNWLDTSALLARSKDDDSSPDSIQVPGVGQVSPHNLRKSRGVLQRTEQIKRNQGFDPLDSDELTRVSEWEQYATDKSGRPTVWSVVVGVFFLIAFFTTFAIDAATAFYVGLVVTVVLGLVTAAFGLLAWLPYRRRNTAVGPQLEALKELQYIYQGHVGSTNTKLSGGLK